MNIITGSIHDRGCMIGFILCAFRAISLGADSVRVVVVVIVPAASGKHRANL